ncbi:MAG: peptidoglycan editing factor PgeF [Dehalococcoidia bacterium]|nr:peptidoglycan editing factor PgeF [Dehalococcoidia bacterium]
MDSQHPAQLPVLTFDLFDSTQVIHSVSTRRGGASTGPFSSLNLGIKVGDHQPAVYENRARFLASLGLTLPSTVALTQVHGTRVVEAARADGGRGMLPTVPPPEAADALITGVPGLGLLVLAADCVPLLFWDPEHRAVAAAHAGWRGSVAGMARHTVAAMGERYGSRPAQLRAAVGPAIGGCCYEVDGPVLAPLLRDQGRFFDRVTTATAQPDRRMLDLKALNRMQLEAAGLRADHIEVSPLCTACNADLLYSERRLGRPCGRFGAVIAIRDTAR